MEQVDLKSWEDFEQRLRDLRAGKAERHDLDECTSDVYVSPLLFRGQANSVWRLTTTLERISEKPFSLDQYYCKIDNIKEEIETFTGSNWQVPSYPDLINEIQEAKWSPEKGLPGYDYMIYLRHHKFPSSLLDWTRSPYVAAYFAFARKAEHAEKVSIYAFQEYAEGVNVMDQEQPNIYRMGHYVRSDKRHFLQKSDYTICARRIDATWHYADHEDVLKKNQNQDVLLKFNIPVSERLKVLRILDDYNINSFSLFGSEESLLETLALREGLLD